MKSVSVFILALITQLVSPAHGAEPFFFIQLSDPQFGMFAEDKNFVQETANYELAVATVNRLRPAFVVVTGDLINKPGDKDQIAEYLRITGKIDKSIPVYNLAGNHDVGNVPTPPACNLHQRLWFGPIQLPPRGLCRCRPEFLGDSFPDQHHEGAGGTGAMAARGASDDSTAGLGTSQCSSIIRCVFEAGG
jgi:hypothetical protein